MWCIYDVFNKMCMWFCFTWLICPYTSWLPPSVKLSWIIWVNNIRQYLTKNKTQQNVNTLNIPWDLLYFTSIGLHDLAHHFQMNSESLSNIFHVYSFHQSSLFICSKLEQGSSSAGCKSCYGTILTDSVQCYITSFILKKIDRKETKYGFPKNLMWGCCKLTSNL